jgi:hypothetical protein
MSKGYKVDVESLHENKYRIAKMKIKHNLKMSLLSYSEDIKEGKCQSIPKPS